MIRSLNRLSCVLLSAMAGVLWLLAAAGAPLPPDKPRTSAHALPSQEVIAAWQSAGVKFGWLRSLESRSIFFEAKDKGEVDELPGFQLNLSKKPTVLAELPAPTVPFGLRLIAFTPADGELKGLTEFQELQSLSLHVRHVTDEGMKEISKL